jgi:hypothetical protein
MIESGFTQSIHKKLPKHIYVWKISDRLTGGVPDAYYSSAKRDCWIEYKYVQKLPKNVKPALSPLQTAWLNARHDEGRNVYVVVGSPEGCILYRDKEWNSSKPSTEAVSKPEMIRRIISLCCD